MSFEFLPHCCSLFCGEGHLLLLLVAANFIVSGMRQLLHLSACAYNNTARRHHSDDERRKRKESRAFDNLQVLFVGHGGATGVPWCVAPETLHPASKVVLVAS
jgi:hypothetical protein